MLPQNMLGTEINSLTLSFIQSIGKNGSARI